MAFIFFWIFSVHVHTNSFVCSFASSIRMMGSSLAVSRKSRVPALTEITDSELLGNKHTRHSGFVSHVPSVICPGPIRLCPAQNDQKSVRATTAKSGNLVVWVFCRRPRGGCLITAALPARGCAVPVAPPSATTTQQGEHVLVRASAGITLRSLLPPPPPARALLYLRHNRPATHLFMA